MMGQEPARFTMPDGLQALAVELAHDWPARLFALRATGTPLNLYDDLTDEQLRERAVELGIQVADDADRDTIAAAVEAKERQQTPPWRDDENFDAEKAWKLIQGLRADVKQLKERAATAEAKVKEHEDATKSQQERDAEARAAAEKTASEKTLEAARLRVALAKGLTETQAKRLVGETEEELEQDADDLLASFKTTDDDQPAGPRRRPTERLRPGAAPSSEPEETDPDKLAAMVPRMY